MPAGTMTMSGGVTEAVAAKAGDHVGLRVQGLGSLSLRFASGDVQCHSPTSS